MRNYSFWSIGWFCRRNAILKTSPIISRVSSKFFYGFLDIVQLYQSTACNWLTIPYGDVRLTDRKRKKRGYSGYDIRFHILVRLYFWRSGECGVPLHYYYFQVHYDPELLYLLGIYGSNRSIVFGKNAYLYVICIKTLGHIFPWRVYRANIFSIKLYP